MSSLTFILVLGVCIAVLNLRYWTREHYVDVVFVVLDVCVRGNPGS